MLARRRLLPSTCASVAFLLCSLALSGVARAQSAPDDPTPNVPDLGGVPQEGDPRPFDQVLDGLAPVHTDMAGLTDSAAASTIGAGSCTLGVGEPTKDGGIVIGTGDWTCGGEAPALAIRVCVDRKIVGQWHEKRCHTRTATDAATASTLTRATCDPGTWTYRTRVLAASFDQQGQPTEAATNSTIATINCMTGPLDEVQLTEYLLLNNDTLYLAECDRQYLIITGPTADVLEASTGTEFDAYCSFLLTTFDPEGDGTIPEFWPTDLLTGMTLELAGSWFCFGAPYTHLGTSGNDAITGSSSEDSILGLDGDDTIIGTGGNDLLCGGPGDDLIYGGAGNDSIDGAGGDDSLYGAEGNDYVLGGEGPDYASGGGGLDYLEGGRDQDTLEGGGDSDTMRGGDAPDDVRGDGGDDFILGEGAADYLRGGSNSDGIYGGGLGDTINADDGNDCHTTDLSDAVPVGCTRHSNFGGVYDGRGIDYLDGGTGWDELYLCADGATEGSKSNFEVIVLRSSDYCGPAPLPLPLGLVAVFIVGIELP